MEVQENLAISSLPDALIDMIFTHLDLPSRANSALVCKRWCSVLKESSICWHTINFPSSTTCDHLVSFAWWLENRCLRHPESIHHLAIHLPISIMSLGAILLDPISSTCTGIRSLVLHTLGNQCTIGQWVASFPHLEEFTLSAAHLVTIEKYLSQVTTLKVLTIGSEGHSYCNLLSKASDWLPPCLEELYFINVSIKHCKLPESLSGWFWFIYIFYGCILCRI